MPQIIKPTTIKVVPRDGELEITLNIHITVDGQVQAMVENAEKVSVTQEEKSDDERMFDSRHFIPNFGSGVKLNFGKTEET